MPTEAQTLLKAFSAEIEGAKNPWNIKVSDYDAGKAILSADPQTQIAVIREALLPTKPAKNWYISHGIGTMMSQLCRRKLPYTLEDLQAILKALIGVGNHHVYPFQALLRSMSYPLADLTILATCRPLLEKLRKTMVDWYQNVEIRKIIRLVDEILEGQSGQTVRINRDHWGVLALTSLEEMEPETRECWQNLARHCASASGSTPSAKWLTQARALVAEVGQESFERQAREWISFFARKHGVRPDEQNAELLRGLIWSCMESKSAPLAAVLGDAAIEGYRKLPGLGPRAPKLGGACVYALKHMPGLQGAAQIERVRLNVKQASFLKGIEEALKEAARKAGMSREDLEELTVPTFDLNDGKRSLPVGETRVELEVVGMDVRTQWYDAAGKARKAASAEVKREHKQELKDLKRLSTDLERMLVAHRERIERLPLTERTWSLAHWRERYLEHPLVSLIARRLIWRFKDGERVIDGIWLDGRLVDVHDQPLSNFSDTTIVSSWHPVFCSPDEVRSWRDWLDRHQITQPFKQAHREVYLLTDAERNTHVYSNRFAAHILRQHQFHALAQGRGWRNQLRLMVDDSYNPATLELPHWNLRAEFWIEGAGDNYGADTNETGTYLYLATDQVRFYRYGSTENYAHAGGGGYGNYMETVDPLPLEDIPPLVLSEVLRDVDLFVGVASVGNDPTWQDGGPQGAFRDYWHSYSFGELSATAQTRKQLLERLLPRLAISERCELDGRFLKVRGELRIYKIHLGSGNILMEPNDQYLCIVPSRGSGTPTGERVFLPFEGDTVFSIILSKAFLLANDRKITDPTITRQIGVAVV
ncbi:DUF4132 domain-containing protein [Ktedonospora formicarum]|uniref:DUF4132 domain-containing protein n=1 Tax=Ktedonospora formicarum TaxID=2778364 RepID=A0A8J3I6B5_9CHLR|nr:DUF4132 domain-containing protein [Ktedonospora formicarum]GHO49446.1 hypothetical protein KSX_76090 [Ktedonospora formicarum]